MTWISIFLYTRCCAIAAVKRRAAKEIIRVVKALGRRLGGIGRILQRLGEQQFQFRNSSDQIDNLLGLLSNNVVLRRHSSSPFQYNSNIRKSAIAPFSPWTVTEIEATLGMETEHKAWPYHDPSESPWRIFGANLDISEIFAILGKPEGFLGVSNLKPVIRGYRLKLLQRSALLQRSFFCHGQMAGDESSGLFWGLRATTTVFGALHVSRVFSKRDGVSQGRLTILQGTHIY